MILYCKKLYFSPNFLFFSLFFPPLIFFPISKPFYSPPPLSTGLRKNEREKEKKTERKRKETERMKKKQARRKRKKNADWTWTSLEREKKERKRVSKRTRPNTRPIQIADGWAGAEMCVFTLSNPITTNRRTDAHWLLSCRIEKQSKKERKKERNKER